MRAWWLLLTGVLLLQANIYDIPTEKSIAVKGKFARNKKCVRCHLDIYKEFKHSAHHLSNILNNEAHKAMWQSNPLSQKQKYLCARCHAPATETIDTVITGDTPVQEGDRSVDDGIGCAFCHRIKGLHPTDKGDHYIISEKKRFYFGGRQSRQKSDFHKIDSNNSAFTSGAICFGCHAHHKKEKLLISNPTKEGYANFCVFSHVDANVTQTAQNRPQENCITCHMPMLEGSFTDRYTTPTHRSHRFLGLRNRFEGVERYLDLHLGLDDGKLTVLLQNRMPHALILHPTRLFKLQLFADDTLLYEKIFEKESGQKDIRPFVWLKENIDYPNNLKAKSSFSHTLHFTKSAGEIKAVLGYYLIKPQIAGRIGLQNEEDTAFHILLQKRMTPNP